jgi:GT2 family glycosyltransferase
MTPQPTTVDLSVLLTSWNTRAETECCLASLPATTGPLRYEVVAVDNASRDGSAELLAADPRVRLIRNPRNVGFAAAVNQAYRAAGGELILLLNSDVRLHDGALTAMIEFLRTNPDAAGVSPLYLNPDGTFQQHYVQLPSLPAALALFTLLRRVPGFRGALHRFQLRGQDFSRPRPLASGSCQLLRRSALDPARIFDEAFPIYWNDAVLARQLDAAGHRVWMIPDAVVTHTRGASCRLLGPAIRYRHLLGGLVCFLRLTRPRQQLWLFRLVLIANHALKTVAGRPTALAWGDLLAALRGDVGPVPDGDTRDWNVTIAGSSLVDRCAPDQSLVDLDSTAIRRLVVRLPGDRLRWRFSVVAEQESLWCATMPTVLPLGRLLRPIGWLNRRIGAALVRRWLDRHAGVRTLRVDARHAGLAGWLGEDLVVRIDHGTANQELAHV